MMGRVLSDIQFKDPRVYRKLSDFLNYTSSKYPGGYFREANPNELTLNPDYQIYFSNFGTFESYITAPDNCVCVLFCGWYCDYQFGQNTRLKLFKVRGEDNESEISMVTSNLVYNKDDHYYFFNLPYTTTPYEKRRIIFRFELFNDKLYQASAIVFPIIIYILSDETKSRKPVPLPTAIIDEQIKRKKQRDADKKEREEKKEREIRRADMLEIE